MRYAIFAAVSTDAQAADDKVSLDEQQNKCREVGTSRGWVETGCYVVPGESRTRWVNLRDAEREIPQLAQMLDDAQAGKFDLLMMYDYNRARDLLQPISKTLAHYGVQLYSVSQPVEPIDPRQYSPYASDASQMMQGMSQIISQAQISDLRRKHAFAMPRRIAQRGLPSGIIPWGYMKPPGRERDSNAVPIQDAAKCAVLVQAKNAFLNGATLSELVSIFSQQPPARYAKTWSKASVRQVLINPFYAGVVHYGASKSVLDPRTGEKRQVPNKERAIYATGKHAPLWDIQTHEAILKELNRRRYSDKGWMNHQFTGILYCGICGARLWAKNSGTTRHNKIYIYAACSSGQHHVTMNYDLLIDAVGRELVRVLNEFIANPTTPPLPESVNLDDLYLQHKRLEDAYQAGAITLQSFIERTTPLKAQIDDAENQQVRLERLEREQAAQAGLLRELADQADYLEEWLRKEEPRKVNHVLHQAVKRITLYQDRRVEIELR